MPSHMPRCLTQPFCSTGTHHTTGTQLKYHLFFFPLENAVAERSSPDNTYGMHQTLVCRSGSPSYRSLCNMPSSFLIASKRKQDVLAVGKCRTSPKHSEDHKPVIADDKRETCRIEGVFVNSTILRLDDHNLLPDQRATKLFGLFRRGQHICAELLQVGQMPRDLRVLLSPICII